MLFGFVLVLNLSSISAAGVNTTSTSIHTNSVEKSGSTLVKTSPTTNALNTGKNSTSMSKFKGKMAAGAPVIVNGLTLAQLKSGLSRVQTFYNKNGRLPKYVSFGTRKIPISTFKKNLATQGLKITTSVNGITLKQLKEGLSRVQTFYNKNGRLPNFVTYGTKKISIATFKKYLAKAGLKIKTKTNPVNRPDTSSVWALSKSLTSGVSSTYSKAVNIFNWVRDNINYSFYYNTKYGAGGTLKYRTGNCCDTANFMVALARDAGITARYVHGTCRFSSGTYGHVWAQFNINGKWYNADGTSYRNSLGVINNWNTATYKLNGYYNTLPF